MIEAPSTAAPRPGGRASPGIVAPPPFLIAVTGHRDLVPGEGGRIAEAVRRELGALLAGLGVAPEEALLLSGLAEGADTLVAETALSMGIPLAAVLPMERSRYEEDFGDPGALERFRSLWERAEERIALPAPEYGARRDAYANLGRFLGVTADLLVAVWDGGAADAENGGTAHVVSLFLTRAGMEGGRLQPSALAPIGPGLLLHIHASRLSSPEPAPDPGASSVRVADPDCGKSAEEVIRLLREERRRGTHPVAGRCLRNPAFRRSVRSRLVPEDGLSLLTEREREILGHQAAADCLAIRFQRRRDAYGKVLLCLGFLTAICAGLYSSCPFPATEGPGGWPGWLWGFAVFLSSAYLIYLYKRGRLPAMRRKWNDDPEEVFEDYRALAEGMRVQIFWHLAGTRGCVADHYLASQRSGLRWIRNALRYQHLRLLADPEAPPADSSEGRRELVRDHWMATQRDWFLKRLGLPPSAGPPGEGSLPARIRRWKCLSLACFLAGLGMCVLLLADSARPFLPEGFHWPTIFLMAFLPVSAGLMRYYLEVMGWEESAEHYRRVLDSYEKALRLLERGEAPLSEVARELGGEALAEQGDWLLFHRRTEVGVAR